MATQPAVSVVMPVYNAEPFLHIAIESVLKQSFTDFELIVVNDGSTDESQSVIARFGDRRLRLITQINRGQSAAINRGVLEGHGHYLKLVDADDWLSPQHLEPQIRVLSGLPTRFQLVAGGIFHTRRSGRMSKRNRRTATMKTRSNGSWILLRTTRA